MSSLKVGDIVEIKIDRLAVGGRGVGRLPGPGLSGATEGGLVVFVADTVPQETVRARLTLLKKNFAEADLVEVLAASPFRVDPPCPVAGRCGGCTWQQVEYGEQLRQKTQIVGEAFRKFSGLAAFEVRPTVPSPRPLRYRNRIQLHVQGNRVGFFKRGTHSVIDIDDCPITEEELTSAIPSLRAGPSAAPGAKSRVEIYRGLDGTIHRSESDGEPALGFSQVNTTQNENLVRYVVDRAKTAAPEIIYDLYGGAGNFTFPLASALGQAAVTAVELSRRSVAIGQDRARAEGLSGRVRFVLSSVEDFARETTFEDESLVLLDPPRTGVTPDVMEKLRRDGPKTIIYVSCHPVTLARDIAKLQGAYRPSWIQPFDMFPQTDHVETVVTLERVAAPGPAIDSRE